MFVTAFFQTSYGIKPLPSTQRINMDQPTIQRSQNNLGVLPENRPGPKGNDCIPTYSNHEFSGDMLVSGRVDLWYSFMSKCFLRCNSESVHLAFEKQRIFPWYGIPETTGIRFLEAQASFQRFAGMPVNVDAVVPARFRRAKPWDFLFAARGVVWGGFTQVWLPVSAEKFLSRKFQVCSFKVFQVERLKEHDWLHNIIAPRGW